MMNQRYHGRVDDDKFKGLKKDKKENKNLWKDTDFYFSVVFQSREQKNAFLDHVGFWVYDDQVKSPINIINGLKLAEQMGIALEEETVKSYPTGDLDLMPFVLDNGSLDNS